MRINITQNKNFMGISFFKIDVKKVKKLLIFLNIDILSVFFDEGNKYLFSKIINTCEFDNYLLETNSIMFDDEVSTCSIDKELDVLTNRRIMITYDLGEKMTNIIINLKNTKITKEEVKVIFK